VILIFDGTNTFLRNFCASPQSDQNGMPVGGLIGTVRSVKFMVRELHPSRVLFVWDAPGGSRRRRGVFAEYKAGRKPHMNREVDEPAKESRVNLDWQMIKCKQLLPMLGVTQVEVNDIEADDTIGYLVGLLDPKHKVIVSGDKDMWQLVSPTTTVYWPTKKVYITPGNFRENCGVLPENFVLARALSGKGDRSDNISGIRGLGEATILKVFPELAERPVTLTELLKRCEDIIGASVVQSKKELQALGITGSKVRWAKTVLDSRDLVIRNVQVMQLTVPNISAQSAGIIKNAALNVRPTFQMTAFKLALLNNGIQLTDTDLLPTFQEYRMRTENGAD
jgi:5'-3' exonuclease